MKPEAEKQTYKCMVPGCTPQTYCHECESTLEDGVGHESYCSQAEKPLESERDQKAAIPERGPGTYEHVLANLSKIYNEKSLRSDADSGIICTLIERVRAVSAERDQLRMERDAVKAWLRLADDERDEAKEAASTAREERDAALESLRYIRELVHKRQLPITSAVWESADATLERLARPIPAEPSRGLPSTRNCL